MLLPRNHSPTFEPASGGGHLRPARAGREMRPAATTVTLMSNDSPRPSVRRRTAKVHATALVVVLLVAGALFFARGWFASDVANALGKAEHPRATITAIDKVWAVACKNTTEDTFRISLHWVGESGPRDGSYKVCLKPDHGDYFVGKQVSITTDPWFGSVSKDMGRGMSWFTVLVLLLVAGVGIWLGTKQYLEALRTAKDPDPRIRG